MAKPNTFASPPRSGADGDNQDSVEVDRFPPRRGNQKEARRTIAVLVGAIVFLTGGVILRETVFATRYNNVPPPDTEITETEGPPRAARSSFLDGPVLTRTTAPVPIGGVSPGASGSLSPFEGSVAPSPAPSPGADTSTAGAYNPFTSGTAPSSPTPIASPPATVALPKTADNLSVPGTLGSASTSVEPPIIPSLSQTGGVYRATLPPPPPGSAGMGSAARGMGSGSAGGTVSGSLDTPPAGAGGSGPYLAPRF